MSIFVYISSISRLYTFKSCLNLFICLYSALLGVKIFLYKQNINKICTDINDMNRYEQICVRPYMLIFLQFICTDMDYAVHICAYLCISVYIKQHLYIIRWATESRACTTWRLCLYWITHCKGQYSRVKQDRWHGQWAKSWPRQELMQKRGLPDPGSPSLSQIPYS